MRKLLLLTIVSAIAHIAFSQSVVKGKVSDTLEKRNLENAVVSLLKKSDSTLFKFVRTNKNGEFSFQKVMEGKYLLLVSYPKFVAYADEFEMNGSEKDLGTIPLTLQSQLMNEVVIRQNIAIRMKGDTIEYKADSFKVAEGASVKELLKKLPGMQVDKNGQITAQGEKVNKVLVDGEEFFSDDPAVVIENLRADAVDKVQSYDKKSDQSEFTGVDDGSRSKTLNLVLKEDKKKGYLGKIVIGGGTSERYSDQAMLNYFKGKKKISVYGLASNTGQTGLGWNDRGKFGSGDDFADADVETNGGMIWITSGDDGDFSDWENQYRDEGIPRTIKAGTHFSNKWNNDKQNINGNYSIKDMNVNAEGNSIKKFLLPDTSYYSNENHLSKSQQTQHLFNGTYDFKLDSMSSLKFKFNGKSEDAKNYTRTNTETLDEDEVLVNRNGRTNSVNSNNKVFLGSALWRQKFKKKGRTVSLSASYKNSNSNSDGYLNSGTDFYTNGNLLRTDSINQYKTNATTTATTNSKLVYTEPAGKKGIVEFNYTFSNVVSNSDRQSFDRVGGKYEFLNPLFSNSYQLNYIANSTGLKYQYTGKKLTANVGTNIGKSNQTQKDSLGKEVGQLRFTNLYPTARINYRFAAQRRLSINYTGSPQSPTIEQVQPILENTNPLFVTLGNPTLKQAFRHNINAFFSDFKTLTGRYVWINGSFTPVDNAIVTSQVIDSGITKQHYVNAQGNYNYWFNGSYDVKIKKVDITVGVNLSSNGGRYVNYVNAQKNSTTQMTNGIGINANKYKENKFSFYVWGSFNYNTSKSSTQKVSYWSQSGNANLDINITKNFIVGSDADFNFRQKTDVFTGNNNFVVWNANVSYKIFKKRNGVFKLELNDILKQRRGYERTFNSNYVFERHYNTLGRYALLSFTWNFTKNPGAPAQTK
jgi:hypothetical protein